MYWFRTVCKAKRRRIIGGKDPLFVNRVRENCKAGLTLKEAVDLAVDDCIRNGVLAEVLAKNRAEVYNLILYEYDEQKHMAMEREEGIAIGEVKGEIKGEAKIVAMIRKKMSRGLDAAEISEELELDKAYVEKIYRLVSEHCDSDDLQIAQIYLNEREDEKNR